MALRGADLWEKASRNGVNLAMEASVAGGIPIHTILREGIAGDRVVELYGILNGTSNFILTEIEKSKGSLNLFWRKRNNWDMPRRTLRRMWMAWMRARSWRF